MPTLSINDLQVLSRRGISANNDHSGVRITLDSKGMAWLLNYLYASGQVGATLSLALLKELAKFQAKDDNWLELRFKAVPIPVHSTTMYFQFVFYLNGTPPRAFHAFPPVPSITTSLSVPMIEGGAFKLRNDQIVYLRLTESEAHRLEDGEIVVIGNRT